MFSRHKQSPPLAEPTKWYVEAEQTTPTDADAHEQARAEADALVEDYLDHVSAQILALPRARRTEIRGEIHQHLQALVQAHEELGDDPVTAAQAARKQFGDPAKIGRAFVQAWRPAVSREELTAFPGAAMKQGLLWFGGAALLFYLQAIASIVFFNYVFWSPSLERLVMLCLLLLPCVAGWQVGRSGRARPSLGAFYALAALAFAFLPITLLNLANTSNDGLHAFREMLSLFTPMFALWMPLGSLAAAVSGARNKWRPARFRLAR